MTIKAGTGALAAALLFGYVALMEPAAASMRCGTDLVLDGDTRQELLDACGEPRDGRSGAETDVWVYEIDGEYYRVHLINGMVARIEEPE